MIRLFGKFLANPPTAFESNKRRDKQTNTGHDITPIQAAAEVINERIVKRVANGTVQPIKANSITLASSELAPN